MSMIELKDSGVLILNGSPSDAVKCEFNISEAREKTIAYRILRSHDKNAPGCPVMNITYDAMISHDITYVSIIQTARASGMNKFPLPYALTNCHNSLCAVGGTINEDDHSFGLSAAKKYGGIYVPANQAVIHQFAREYLSGCGKMILGSDSHTRYGCYGTMGVGEGGGELTKQLLKNTWDIDAPEIILVWLQGYPRHGIGPHDVAIALCGATFSSGFVKNKILEFAGPGLSGLSMDFRSGIDVMTTETSCLSSIWETDDTVKAFYENVGRPEDFRQISIADGAYYDGMITVNLDQVESMIALPFHPSKAYTIHELQENPDKIFTEIEASCNQELSGEVRLDLHRCLDDKGHVIADQGIIVGCAGGMYENIAEAASIIAGKSIGNGYFNLSVYPSSASVNIAIIKDGIATDLIEAGAVFKPAFCGPCFGAGDTPAHNTLSIRHSTRNFANREGSKPGNGQIAAVALMDSRSIAATSLNGGRLTAATDIQYDIIPHVYKYDGSIYEKRCYFGYGNPLPDTELRFGPNIRDWPEIPEMKNDLLLKLCAVIHDSVTTTDELIPSGETSSYRSNPVALAEFTLSRRVPKYVGRSKFVRSMNEELLSGSKPGEIALVLSRVGGDISTVTAGSCIFAARPGDGSAREQAASCQKVLGGFANICYEYATKRYRSNCINWGIVPFTIGRDIEFNFTTSDYIYIPDLRKGLLSGLDSFPAIVITDHGTDDITLYCNGLTAKDRQILIKGCLMNYYASERKKGDSE